MTIQVLISTMFLKDPARLLEKMNIQTDAVIIDQCDCAFEESISFNGKTVNIIHTNDRGLSKSRNTAISRSAADIMVFADDDFRYVDGYEQIITGAYKEFPNADAVIFGAVRVDKFVYKTIPDGKMSRKNKFSINSVRITVKRKAVTDKQLCFDEHFGSGTDICGGEDTIFISDCFNAKLNFYSKDRVICHGFDDGRASTWWKGYNEKFFEDKGTAYKRLSKNYLMFILYFALKNYKKYKADVSFFNAIKWMLAGSKREW